MPLVDHRFDLLDSQRTRCATIWRAPMRFSSQIGCRRRRTGGFDSVPICIKDGQLPCMAAGTSSWNCGLPVQCLVSGFA
jgi:hypothetical protein